MKVPASVQRILVGMFFGFILGAVLYQSSRVRMQEPEMLKAFGVVDACHDCTVCQINCPVGPGHDECLAGCVDICAPCYNQTSSACPQGEEPSGGICCPKGYVNHDGTCYPPCTAPGYCETEPGCTCGFSSSSASAQQCCNPAVGCQAM